MKTSKPFKENCNCQVKNCTKTAVAWIFGRKVCRKHYAILKLDSRKRRRAKQ